ncbi:MAG TPA: DUF433 domain-containing protein [Streptosporangiaceae bacterium]|nr:DUF433 domain-containing protein [Streptosporangiaceae bacterium]HUA41117.1 DUF433 domain-containing protein [Streptosporangiaceae bacterium]
MAAASEELIAFQDTRAARLAHVSLDRLRYWEETQLVVPSVHRQISARNTVRLYSFQDMLALLVVALLRTERGVSLQHIRRVVNHLEARGYEAPLRELKFATLGNEIYFQHPDGSWEGDLQPDQIVLEKTIRLEPLRTRINNAARARDGQAGRIVTRRGVMGSKPIFAGTRILVDTVRSYLDAGYDDEAILQEYPSLTSADIEAAREYAA